MKFDFGAVFEQFISLYTKLPLAQKIAVPIIIAATMGTIVFVTQWAGRADYQVLYSGLEDADASAVIEHLKDSKIEYRVTGKGSVIEVSPPSVVNEIRLELAGSGVPKGGSVGFELFQESALGRTGYVEQIYFAWAVQGELERTIKSIEVIRNVRVHITNPKRSHFKSRDVLPTASVLLSLKPTAELSDKQIKGIANLVAGAVERMIPENVTILDTQGNQLNQKRDDDELGGADVTRLEYQHKIESAYVQRIESMLSEILGKGRAVARVTTELDFNKYEKEEEMYDPAGTVTRSERVVNENVGAIEEGGVPGMLSNLTDNQNALTGPNASTGGNRRSEKVRNYEVSRSVSRTVSETGRIVRISVAVLVDGIYTSELTGELDADGNESTKMVYHQIPENTIKQIKALVRQAIGYDAARGDQITVENIQFVEPQENLEEIFGAIVWQDWVAWTAEKAVPALFMLLFFLFVVRPLMRYLLTETESEADLSRLLPAGIEELEVELEAERVKLKSVPELPDTPTIDIEELEELLAENSRIVKESPQQAALLIRYWLNEGRV